MSLRRILLLAGLLASLGCTHQETTASGSAVGAARGDAGHPRGGREGRPEHPRGPPADDGRKGAYRPRRAGGPQPRPGIRRRHRAADLLRERRRPHGRARRRRARYDLCRRRPGARGRQARGHRTAPQPTWWSSSWPTTRPGVATFKTPDGGPSRSWSAPPCARSRPPGDRATGSPCSSPTPWRPRSSRQAAEVAEGTASSKKEGTSYLSGLGRLG